MDYSIGSLSDLITGGNTPNKQKVKTKTITPDTEFNDNEDIEVRDTEIKEDKPKKIKSASPAKTSVKTSKKRKLQDTHNNEPKLKKSKNSENAENRIALKENAEKKVRKQEDPEVLARTVFVGNLPITVDTKKLKKFFAKYGKVEAVRIRGVPVADPKTPKKVALIKKEFHPERKSLYGYVRFEQREDAIKSTEVNGIIFKDHHLRIHLCTGEDKPDETKAIFVGNLSFYAEEEDLWKLFEPCGPIASVRIVRDGKTGIGKGFGYVNFQNSDSVTLALEMENVKLKERELRISICNIGAAKKNKKKNKVKKISKPGKPPGITKITNDNKDSLDENKKLKETINEPFQGVKFAEKKKKNKLNKGLLQKKKMIKKVAPK